MAPVELIRKFIPTKIRIKAYVWAISIAGISKILLYPFLYILHGAIPKGISIVDKKPMYHYKGIQIDSPKDSVEAYVEVFLDEVYDKIASPQEGNIVIDIGAYVGMYTIKASHLVGDTGLVVAVEPLLSNLGYLESNLSTLTNTKIVNVALSNYCGEGKLYSSPSSAAHSMAYVQDNYNVIEVTTLDRLVKELGLDSVDYIKIDAEGSELKILEGATHILKEYSPVLSIASYHTDSEGRPYASRVISRLKGTGYSCFTEKGYVYASK